MQGGNYMLLEEPVRLASVLAPAKPKVFPSLTKIVGTLGPNSHSVEVIEACLTAGMSVARFDFSWKDAAYHQETLDNLRKAAQNVKKLCPIMLDTVGPEIQVDNSTGGSIELIGGNHVTITSDLSKAPSADVLPIKFGDLAKVVKKGDTLFIGQYLFTGSESTSLWLEVTETCGEEVICLVKNTATLSGPIFTLHVSQAHVSMPTLSEYDKQVISTWGLDNSVDIISLSHTRSSEDVRELRAFLLSHDLQDTQIYAKIENSEGLEHFDEILQEADGIIICRGDLGIDLPPERVFMSQKTGIHKCNLAGKPVIITRVVDSMIDNLRPTRAEATDVANAVLDGTDGILLGAETLRGQYPVDSVSTVGRICAEAETVYNQSLHFKKVVRHVGEPMAHEESVASSAVRSAMKVKAAAIVVFTFSGRAARLIAKYRPPMPVLAVVFPREGSDPSKWRAYGTTQARQCFSVRGAYPLMGSTDEAETGGLTKEEYCKREASISTARRPGDEKNRSRSESRSASELDRQLRELEGRAAMGLLQMRSSVVAVVTLLLLLLACCEASSSSQQQQQTRKMLNAVTSPSGKRVDVYGCSEPEELVTVSQNSDASLHSGMPAYTVEISNNCIDCTVCDVHLSCGDFANTELVDPATFRRLGFDDCLVKDGGAIGPSEMIIFQYDNSFVYSMKVAYASCSCDQP